MKEYEITYLIPPQVEEEAREKLNTAVDEEITNLSGAVTHTSPTIRRKLAYYIQNHNTAFMRTMQITLPPENVSKLNTYLKRAKNIMRATLLQTPPRTRVPEETIDRILQGKTKKKEAQKPEKEVTMKDVEKGIEEALTEEVK